MLNIFAITFYQPSITVFEILAENLKKLRIRDNNSYKESSYNFGTTMFNVALDILNIFAFTFYQPSITLFEILAKNLKKL